MAGALAVALDVSAVPAEPVGAGRYSLELARALAARSDVALVLLARQLDAERWRSAAPGARRVLPVAPEARPARLLWGELALPARLRASGARAEVLHEPHYTMPLRPAVPVVVTVHDLTFLTHPEWHERSKVPVFRRALRVAAARAAAIVCPSVATAEAYAARYAPRGPIEVAPHGVDHERFRPVEAEPGADRATLERLGVRGRYLLHVGTIEPRKDLPSLVAAFDRLAAADPELELVLAGGAGWGSEELGRALARARHGSRVRRLGYVAEPDVPALLRSAAAVAYPSLEEGFGLPALEALACAAPLVTTAGTVMAELAGPAALVIPVRRPDALADALAEVLAGGAGVAARRALGIERAARYTWAASADVHVRIYRVAAAR